MPSPDASSPWSKREVYAELRRRAAAYLRRERPDHTLEPTALVHEAYIRLAGQERVDWHDRARFCGLAAQMMRRILVDHARGHRRGKRSGAFIKTTLTDGAARATPREVDLLALDEALEEMAAVAPRHARIVELRFFAGLAEKEVAEVLEISRSTVTREWQLARTWLHRRLKANRDS